MFNLTCLSRNELLLRERVPTEVGSDNTLTRSSAYIDKLSILQFRPGECNPGHIRSVVCKVDADPDILRGFLNCLEQQDICGTLEHLKTTDVSVFSF